MKLTFQLAALLTIILTPASADTITILSATSIANATTERDAWLTANFGSGATAQALTGFEGNTYGPWTSLVTTAGTFSAMAGGLPATGAGTHHNEFTILNSSDTPFQGRYNTTPGGNNWLDSNGITQIQLSTTLNTLYFFMTDVNDTGGRLAIQTADGTASTNFTGIKDSDLFFVGITSSDPIGYVRWLNTSQSDGYGLDDLGTVKYPSVFSKLAPVPEPNSWIAAACAMLMLAVVAARRDRKERS